MSLNLTKPFVYSGMMQCGHFTMGCQWGAIGEGCDITTAASLLLRP